jgi:hypothetical protein
MRKLLVFGFVALAVAGSTLAQSPVTFSHVPVECVSAACGRTLITAKVESSVPLQSVRVYFNHGSGPEYYVEMLHGGDWYFSAVLPAVAPGTEEVAYRIVAIAEDGSAFEGPTGRVVASADCVPTAMTDAQAELAENTALGLTTSSQSGVPVGFSCAGLVRTIDSGGEVMANNVACEEVRLANTDPCLAAAVDDGAAVMAGAAAQGGVTTGQAIAYTAAGVAVGAGAAIIYENSQDDKEPISRSRP